MRIWKVTIEKWNADKTEIETIKATINSRNAQTAASVFQDLRTENHRVIAFEVREVKPVENVRQAGDSAEE